MSIPRPRKDDVPAEFLQRLEAYCNQRKLSISEQASYRAGKKWALDEIELRKQQVIQNANR